MSGKITYFKTEDFNQRGEFNQFHSECKLDDLVFRKGDTVNQLEIKQVLDICKKYNGFDMNTLIVKSEEYLTIWIEQKSQPSPASENPEQQQAVQPQAAPSSTPQQPLPTKVVTKRYRGQVYEETVVDWTAVQQLKQTNKTPRKYRGQYID